MEIIVGTDLNYLGISMGAVIVEILIFGNLRASVKIIKAHWLLSLNSLNKFLKR